MVAVGRKLAGLAGLRRRMRLRRVANRVWESLWFVPAVYVLVALGLSVGLVRWDEADPIVLTRSLNASSATSALSALGSGMIAFTGFVTSVVLLLVQFGTSEFSPRFVAWFRRDRTLKFALSTFSATFLFALVSTAQIGRGTAAFVPSRTLLAALLLTLLSILMFLLLIDRTSNDLRVAHVVQVVDGEARKVFDAVYPASASDAATAQKTARSLNGRTPVQTVSLGAVGQVVVALDRTRDCGPRGEVRRCRPARAGHRRSCPGRRHTAQRLRIARAARAAAPACCGARRRADDRR